MLFSIGTLLGAHLDLQAIKNVGSPDFGRLDGVGVPSQWPQPNYGTLCLPIFLEQIILCPSKNI